MDSKSNQIFCQDIIQIFYKNDPLQFLLDLEQISIKLGNEKSTDLLEKRYLQK